MPRAPTAAAAARKLIRLYYYARTPRTNIRYGGLRGRVKYYEYAVIVVRLLAIFVRGVYISVWFRNLTIYDLSAIKCVHFNSETVFKR